MNNATLLHANHEGNNVLAWQVHAVIAYQQCLFHCLMYCSLWSCYQIGDF